MKKRTCYLLVMLAMMFWPATCQALPDQNGEYTKLGVGNLKCDLWTQVRRSGDVNAVWWKTLILGWVQGFLTAYNVYGPGAFDVTQGKDASSVAEWVDNYCVEHPLDNIARATEALTAALHKPWKEELPSSPTGPR
jgi:hypothetical protein